MTAPNATSPLPVTADAEDIILCTMGRLTRNLAGIPFPGWSTEKDRAAVVAQVLPVLQARRGFKTARHADMAELNYEKRRELLSRALLTPVMAARGKGCHLILPGKNRRTAVMLNEEEHIVCHFFRRGDAAGALDSVLEEMTETASYLQEHLPLAHNRRNGYLTSAPTEAGDGMRFGAMLHLPGLGLAGMLGQVSKAMEKLHLYIAPAAGNRPEETEDSGHLYSLFSMTGPERSAEEMADYFHTVITRLAEREQQVRRKLLLTDTPRLKDSIGRAYGLLRYAGALSHRELQGALSLLRLGSVQGLIRWEEPLHAILPLLRELPLLLLSTPDDAELPQRRAAAVRLFLDEHPHNILFL